MGKYSAVSVSQEDGKEAGYSAKEPWCFAQNFPSAFAITHRNAEMPTGSKIPEKGCLAGCPEEHLSKREALGSDSPASEHIQAHSKQEDGKQKLAKSQPVKGSKACSSPVPVFCWLG